MSLSQRFPVGCNYHFRGTSVSSAGEPPNRHTDGVAQIDALAAERCLIQNDVARLVLIRALARTR